MSVKMRFEFDSRRLLGAVSKANRASLRRAGAYVRKAARNAVFKSKRASEKGTPPHTRRGLLKRSTRTAETLDSVRRGQKPDERGYRPREEVHRRVHDSPRIRRDVPQTPLPETSPHGTHSSKDRSSAPEAVGECGQKTMKGIEYGHQTWS